MNCIVKKFYNTLPYFGKCFLASLKGYSLKNLRYDKNTEQRIKKFISRKNWTEERWEKYQLEKLNLVLLNARENVPFYKKYWDNKLAVEDGLEYRNIAHWPIISKKDVQKNEGLFLDRRISKNDFYIDHTSGTTGTPINIYLSKEAVKNQYALFYARVKNPYGIKLDDAWAIIGSQQVTDVKRKTPPYWVFNCAEKQLYLSALHIAQKNAKAYYLALKKYKPRYLIAYTYSVYYLAKYFLEIELTYKLKAVICNGEPVFDFQRKIIEKVFKCPAVNTYGQAELVSYANQFPDGTMRVSPEMGYIEKIPIEGNHHYSKLVCTSLLNDGMVLIRYDTSDLVANNILEPIRDGLPIFPTVIGRDDDVLKLSNGRKIVQIDGVFTDDLGLIKGQIIQCEEDLFHIKVVPISNWDDRKEATLISRLKKRIGDLTIEIQVCHDIPPEINGKFKVIKSYVK